MKPRIGADAPQLGPHTSKVVQKNCQHRQKRWSERVRCNLVKGWAAMSWISQNQGWIFHSNFFSVGFRRIWQFFCTSYRKGDIRRLRMSQKYPIPLTVVDPHVFLSLWSSLNSTTCDLIWRPGTLQKRMELRWVPSGVAFRETEVWNLWFELGTRVVSRDFGARIYIPS